MCDAIYAAATADSADSDTASPSWIWLVDVERACTLLIGRCLGGMLMGIPLSPEEVKCREWMNSPLFGSGAEPSASDTGSNMTLLLIGSTGHTGNMYMCQLGSCIMLPGLCGFGKC